MSEFKPTHDSYGRCYTCGRKRAVQKRKRPTALAISLGRTWRLAAYPLSYRVQRLQVMPYAQNRPIWIEVQRLPRTRNVWQDDELMCAISMFRRRLKEWTNNLTPPTRPEPTGWRLWVKRYNEFWGV